MLIELKAQKVTRGGAQHHRQSQPEQYPDSQVRDSTLRFS